MPDVVGCTDPWNVVRPDGVEEGTPGRGTLDRLVRWTGRNGSYGCVPFPQGTGDVQTPSKVQTGRCEDVRNDDAGGLSDTIVVPEVAK